MAEGIAFDLVTGVLGKLGSALWDEIGLLRSFKDDAKDLERQLKKIKAKLLDAEERSNVEIEEAHALRIWLSELKGAAYDIDDLLDEIQTQALLRKQQREVQNQNQLTKKACAQFLSCANPIHLKFKFKMAHRMKELRENIDKITTEMLKFGLVEAGPRRQAEFKRSVTTISVFDEKKIVGREDDKEKIVKLLLETGDDHDVSVIPIVGLGGLGKTTLAKLAFNEEQVKADKRFDLRVWVCVSTDFDTKKIAEAVKSTTRGEGDLSTKESSNKFLLDTFSQKKFLLVLDDVWNEDQGKWEELKVIFKDGKKGSKILVTTRSEKVAKIMKTVEQPHRVKGLSDDDCWTLFKRRAFEEGEENRYPILVPIGKQIVKKCGGVPLAANALGSMMRFKSRTEDAWSAIRDSQIWRLEEKNEILPSLKLSYIPMPSALKQCFAYCSIFPKDHAINKDDLIQQWIALGFISSHGTTSSMEDIGNEYFNDLVWMSFLQNVTEGDEITCQMHDLVHDLAQSVAREEVAVIVGENSTSIPEGCRYASIHSRSIQQVPTTVKQRLRALRFGESASLTTFYSEANCLRLLDLHDLEIFMLPSSIGKLKLLRYLNLSWTNIQELPESITSLYNLQTLNLSFCQKIHTLPKFLGRLANLRILNLSQCSCLQSLPSSLCQLKNLHDLNLSRLGDLQALPESIGNLENLRILNLYQCNNLLSLPSSTSDLQHLEKLDIRYCHHLCELPKMIENLTKLRELLNYGCSELKAMPRGIGKLVSLQKLPVFVIGKQGSIEHCASISELKQLNNLDGKLEIKGLENVTNPADAKAANLIEKKLLRSLELKWNVLSAAEDTDTVQPAEEMDAVLENLQLPQNLEKLVIEGYAGGKFPSWMMNSIDSCLSKLVEIELVNIPRCSSLPPLGLLSVLKYISIENMPRCSSLPPLGQFPLLERLTIRNMAAITNLGVEFDGDSHINESANKFPALRRLYLSDMPTNLKYLNIYRCSSLRYLPVHKMTALTELSIHNCPLLFNAGGDVPVNERPEPCLPSSVQELFIFGISKECLSLILKRPTMDSETPPDDGNAVSLQQPNMVVLRDLTIGKCQQLTCLPEGLRSFTSLQKLAIKNCGDLERIEDWLGELTKLEYLNIYRCSSLRYLPVHKMTTLTSLSIKDCPLLFNAGGDVGVNERPEPCLPSSVQALEISGISKECLSLILKRPTMDSETPADDGDAASLQQPNMVGLQQLTIEKCQQLTCLPEGLRSFTSLQTLTIMNCEDFERIEDWIGELTNLDYLYIGSCQSLRYLPAHKMTTLQYLGISGCPRLFNADDGQFVDTNVDHIERVIVDGREYEHKKQVSSSSQEEEKKSWTGCWGKLDWSKRRA